MLRPIGFNEKKFRELVLYIAAKSESDPKFGATKLNKILFHADFGAFLESGAPITGAVYQRLPNGPAPRALLPVKKRMEQDREIVERELRYGPYRQRRVIALRDPDMSLFSAEEIAQVDATLSALEDMNATQVSHRSHRVAEGWHLASHNETIPYETALLDATPIDVTQEHIEHAQRLAEALDAAA